MSRPTMHKLSNYQTYSIAHTARCKLGMTAANPDRYLRFMLGHAFMLDKALYRVAEIENTAEADAAAAGDEPPEGQKGSLAGGSVAFKGESTEDLHRDVKKVQSATKVNNNDVATSEAERESTASDEEREAALNEYDDFDDEEGGDFNLTRFVSASQMPPRMIPDEGDDVEEEDEAISPPALPADFDVAGLVQSPEDEEMGELYELVRTCPCQQHPEKTDKSRKFWEVKDPTTTSLSTNKRLAVMQVEA